MQGNEPNNGCTQITPGSVEDQPVDRFLEAFAKEIRVGNEEEAKQGETRPHLLRDPQGFDLRRTQLMSTHASVKMRRSLRSKKLVVS